MRIVGVAIGALLVGGAVIALMPNASATNGGGGGDTPTVIKGCMNPDATNYNPDATEDNGSCIFADQNDQQDYADEIAEQEREKAKQERDALIKTLEKNCFDLYNSSGIRQGDGFKKVLTLKKTGDNACDVEEIDVVIYADKEYYIVGEQVNIYVGKRFVSESPGSSAKQNRWFSRTSYKGEELGFKLGVWDEFGGSYGEGATVILRSWGPALNGSSANNSSFVTSNDINCANTNPPTNNADANDPRCYSWQKFSFNTSYLANSLVEPLGFTVKGKIYRGNQGVFCKGTIDETDGTNGAFIIFPKECSIDYLQKFGMYENEAESFNSEGREIEESFQSYISEWV